MRPVLQVEIKDESGTFWSNCSVMAFDSHLDICLLECESDLPWQAQFADQDTTTGSPVLLVACPTNTSPAAYDGYVAEQDGVELSTAWVDFFKQGCSGCPVFDGASQKVIGVAIAGVRAEDGGPEDMDPHTSLFIPLASVKQFLTQCLIEEFADNLGRARLSNASLERAEFRDGEFVEIRSNSAEQTDVPASESDFLDNEIMQFTQDRK